jgi:hypothetical protein
MKTAQLEHTKLNSWSGAIPSGMDGSQTLVLAFGSTALLTHRGPLEELRAAFPNSLLMGCSSAGEIAGSNVGDEGLSVVVAQFDTTRLMAASTCVRGPTDSQDAGHRLAAQLPQDGLHAVFVLSTGLNVNGAGLVRGITASLPKNVIVSGGLAVDGSRFERTWVLDNTGLYENAVAAVGFYGNSVRVSHGCVGGWTEFGPGRTVTRSTDNILHELDGQPALALYKHYLGERAADLPGSALLFPLALRIEGESSDAVVRTILGVDEATQSMTFAGDIPHGASVRLMRTTVDRLVTGAEEAAQHARRSHDPAGPVRDGSTLALIVSCVGRRLVMGERTEEEVEAVVENLPEGAVHAGFYSYGEIAPANGQTGAQLHNQTITLTVLSEA